MLKIAALLAVVATAHAEVFTWAGRPTNFDDVLNWDGPRPSDGVGTLSIGTFGSGVIKTPLPTNAPQMVGKILFSGPATLLLGSATGKSKLVFDDQSNTKPSTSFHPDSDFGCNQRWVTEANPLGAPTPPCGSDSIVIPGDASYYLEIPVDLGISSIQFANDGVNIVACSGENQMGLQSDSGNSVVSFPNGCDASVLGSGVDQESCPFTSCTTTTTMTSTTTSSITSTTTSSVSSTTTIVPEVNAFAASSTGIGIIAGGSVLALILILAVVFVVLYVDKNSKAADRAVQSFENPMYANTDVENSGKSQQANTGYMDVPIGGEDKENPVYELEPGADDLYDEVNNGQNATETDDAGGYMDVNEADQDDEDDEDDADF